jgi:hypothetical protein
MGKTVLGGRRVDTHAANRINRQVCGDGFRAVLATAAGAIPRRGIVFPMIGAPDHRAVRVIPLRHRTLSSP